MDVLESPLNQAHQQGRRADILLKKEKYEEAIGCHKKSADLLLAAMRTTHTQGALQSLTLQREYHLKQEAVIRQRQRHALIAQRKLKRPPGPSVPPDQADERQSAATTNGGDSDVMFATRIANRLADTIARGQDAALTSQTVEECDSLLQMLSTRQRVEGGSGGGGGGGGGGPTPGAVNVAADGTDAPPGGQQVTNGIPMKGVKSPNGTKSPNGIKSPNGTKSPKDDTVVIEELRVHNVALCGHIVDLLKEIELGRKQLQLYQRENGELRDRLSRPAEPRRGSMEDSTDSEKYYPVPIGMNLHDLPMLELPPLEMPKFDFSILKIDSVEHQE